MIPNIIIMSNDQLYMFKKRIDQYKLLNMDRIRTYYLSNKDSERDLRMKERFKILNIDANQIQWVNTEWLKSKGFDSHSCQWGHIAMIKQFLEDIKDTDINYGCFFEDDVYLHKHLPSDMSFLLNQISYSNLDVLLIGYLINYKPIAVKSQGIHDILHSSSICRYDNELWGAQGYILTKGYAMYLVDKYNEEYLVRFLNGLERVPFASDWTITKDGNRALVYPMYAVEEGTMTGTHQGQVMFHKICHVMNYNENYI